MNRLRRIAIILTTVSALTVSFLGNTALAKPKGGRPCVLVFEVPFTDKFVELPTGMWGLVPLSVSALSTLAAVTIWIVLLFRWLRKARRA
jgi:hypothetical protein